MLTATSKTMITITITITIIRPITGPIEERPAPERP